MAILQGFTIVETIMFGTIFCVYLFDLTDGRPSGKLTKGPKWNLYLITDMFHSNISILLCLFVL